LQQTADHELYLYADVKEQCRPVAQIMILSLSSQPVDQEDRRTAPAADTGLSNENDYFLFCCVWEICQED
jgi:hypothetical protein